MQRYYVHKWRAVSLQWVPQTVEALSYSSNSTGWIRDRTERISYAWNLYWFNSASTNKDYHLLYSRSEDYA